jgi:hypothetical protein
MIVILEATINHHIRSERKERVRNEEESEVSNEKEEISKKVTSIK